MRNAETPRMSFDEELGRLRASGRAFAIATVVRTVGATSAKPGSKAVLDHEGVILEGWIGGGCARGAIGRAAKTALSSGAPQFVSLRPQDLLDAEGVAPGDELDGVRFARNGCPSKGSMDVFIEPVLPQPELVILGESPVAFALAKLAGHFDLRRTVCAPGLSDEALPGVERVSDGFALEVDGASRRHIVIATQGKGDEAALRAAVSAGSEYIAFVGSRRKFATLAERLKADGVDASRLDAVKAPAGLDIKAISPEEIALSILAELVSVIRAEQRPDGPSGAGDMTSPEDRK
ncbi:XdhC family protein [Tropicimonas sp. TH_r6]|uniref:XdhC family protein n=1 Tax=Tropicimonas sp. TH_r6 TaxID=3082085 RepID=UPI0029551078|nr:XdhC family protein [Tropicimonas sp. TH_r6]MDV7145780.1 XdhC family protein [Tropicimonas sp. TH_r6]